MIVARKVPGVAKVPVYVNDHEYEIWISRPVSLGTIRKIGYFWYSVDGEKFRSGRLAMAYVIRSHEEGKELVPREIHPITRPKKPKKVEQIPEILKYDLDMNDPLVMSVLKLLSDKGKEAARDKAGKDGGDGLH